MNEPGKIQINPFVALEEAHMEKSAAAEAFRNRILLLAQARFDLMQENRDLSAEVERLRPLVPGDLVDVAAPTAP